MEIAVSLDETAVESHTTIEGREVRDVIRKPYNTPNKKGNCPKSRPRNYLWISCKEVLYGHSERSGVLYGNHIYTVITQDIMNTVLKVDLIENGLAYV